MKDVVFTLASVCVATLPVLLISRWRHWGVLVSVLFGWAVLHVINSSFAFEEPVEAVFTGLWAALGGVFMLAWCLLIYGVVILRAWTRKRSGA